MFLCAVDMLNHVNLQYHAKMIYNAVMKVVKQGKVSEIFQVDYMELWKFNINIIFQVITKDFGGQSSTSEFTYAVINALQQQ